MMTHTRTETLMLMLMATVVLLMVAIAGLFFHMTQLQREVLVALRSFQVGRPEGLKVGTQAPDFTLIATEGQPVALSDLAGQKLLLAFTSTECSACTRIYPALRGLTGSGLSVRELAAVLADLPISVPGQDAPMRYGDLPGRDAAHIRGWAKTLSQVDPDVAQHHAEGRMDEYVRNVHLEAALRRLTCPVLLLQADVVSDSDAELALALLANGVHAKLEEVGHSLGLDSWKVAPLLRAVSGFLESL